MMACKGTSGATPLVTATAPKELLNSPLLQDTLHLLLAQAATYPVMSLFATDGAITYPSPPYVGPLVVIQAVRCVMR